jgi:hypothetical protein
MRADLCLFAGLPGGGDATSVRRLVGEQDDALREKCRQALHQRQRDGADGGSVTHPSSR